MVNERNKCAIIILNYTTPAAGEEHYLFFFYVWRLIVAC
jgi:hypothetical protein